MELLEVANVERGDGHWTTSYQFDSVGCAMYSMLVDVCSPTRENLTNNSGQNPSNYSRTVINKSLTSNVATLTSPGHGFLVGDSVVVASVGAPFDGTYTLTAVTPTTFSYARVNANVASAAATGTATGPNNSGSASAGGLDGYIFAVITSLRGRAICSDGTEEARVRAALDAEVEKAVGKVLVDGNGGQASAYLESAAIQTVAAGATTKESVVAALEEFWTIATGIKTEDTIVHLGLSSVFGMLGLLDRDTIYGTNIKVATNPLYPDDLVAVTGPINIKMGSDQTVFVPNTANNDLNNEATRLVAVDFDPCTAVRAV